MRNRTYNTRTIIFVVVAIIFMVGLDRISDPRWRLEKPENDAPQTYHEEVPVPAAQGEEIVAEANAREVQGPPAPVRQNTASAPLSLDDRIAPEMMGPYKPSFQPPLEFSMMQTILPLKTQIEEEDRLEPAWIKYAVPSDVAEDKPRVVIIIDDMGMDRKHTREVMALPGPLTLAFLPYAGDLGSQTKEARERGHELMVHVPMAAMNDSLDGGPAVLHPNMSPEDFERVLRDDLAAFTGYVGINNHMGSRTTQDTDAMARIMAVLKQRGLLFVDSKTIGLSVAVEEAKKAGVPFAARDVFLDHEETQAAVMSALAEVERKARAKGLAIAIGHPKRETIEALRAWIPTLAGKGIYMVPVSEAVTVPQGANSIPVLNLPVSLEPSAQ